MASVSLGELTTTFLLGAVAAPLLAALTLLAACFELLRAPCARAPPREVREPTCVLVTGASSGLGEALARHYARPGRTLLLTGRSAEGMRRTTEACLALGATVRALDNNDLATEAGRAAMREWARARDAELPIDLVVANAGVDAGTCGAPDKEDLADVTRRVFAINVDGAFATAFAVLDKMRARGRGQIGLVSSIAGLAPVGSSAAYSASKSALKVFGESLRWQLLREGVRVNVVCPGYVDTGLTRSLSFKISGILGADAAAAAIAQGFARDAPVTCFPTGHFAAQWLSAALPPVVRDCVARNRIFGGAAGYMRPKKAAAASAAANGTNTAKAK